MFDLENLLDKLNICESKKQEIYKKEQLKNNLEYLYTKYDTSNKLLYTLACTAPKKANLSLLGELVNDNVITNESILRELYKLLNKKEYTYDELKEYIMSNIKNEEEIKNIIVELAKTGMSKREMLIRMKKEAPLADSKFVMEEINKMEIKEDKTKKDKKCKDWLEEGEILKLHKPGENPQLNDKIMQEHLKRTGGRVVTRFPPEPNGILHIGHAKAINLDFGYAEKYNGYTYLRFDDTNPRNEEEYYFDSIIEDVKWLGFKPKKITASSDYFEKMIEFGRILIQKEKAYICELSVDEIKRTRREFSEEIKNLKDEEIESKAHILSPWRDRSVNDNLEIYERMVNKEFVEGQYTLRFKMNLSSRNPLMFDLVGMRIINQNHVKTKDKYNLYPSYEFALCVADSLEDVTHSFCTREFYTRQESYNWLLDELELYKPVQWEFSRLNISNTILSKRKLVPLEKYGIKLDDPRLYTIKGMRRRGIPAEAINKFVRSLGITYSETIIDNKIFESFIRDELNKTARRLMCVIDPIKVKIINTNPKKILASDSIKDGNKREIKFTPDIYIERSDFEDTEDKDFLRFTPTQPVGLYLYKAIKFIRFEDDTIIAEETDETPKKYIHWVSQDSTKVEIRIYDQLFTKYNTEEGDIMENINLDSKKVIFGYCDDRIKDCKAEDKFQFQRIGYFCVDSDTRPDNIVLNKTISLK